MSRPIWKGPCVNESRLANKNKIVHVSRNSEIVPRFIGFTFKIHTGKKYTNLTVTTHMIGHKFGEFVFTRAVFAFKKGIRKK